MATKIKFRQIPPAKLDSFEDIADCLMITRGAVQSLGRQVVITPRVRDFSVKFQFLI